MKLTRSVALVAIAVLFPAIAPPIGTGTATGGSLSVPRGLPGCTSRGIRHVRCAELRPVGSLNAPYVRSPLFLANYRVHNGGSCGTMPTQARKVANTDPGQVLKSASKAQVSRIGSICSSRRSRYHICTG